MAATRSGNTYYCPANETNTLAPTNNSSIKIKAIWLTCSGGAGTATIKNNTGSPATQLELAGATDTTQYFRLDDAPIVCPLGVVVVTSTNANITLVIEQIGA
jgi:hypothetical protein